MKAVTLASLVVLIIMAYLAIQISAKDLIVGVLGDEFKDNLLALYSNATNPDPSPEELVPIPYTGLNPFGVNVFLDQEVEESEIRRTLQMIKDAGFGWVKQQFLWSDIEIPSKGQHVDIKYGGTDTWAKYDRIVNLANEYGLGLIARLDTSPSWARAGTDKIETPPDRYDDYGDFVYQVASRYRGRLKYYVIWNEPNTAFEWGNRTVSAADYVRLLKVAYQRAKEADPDAVILAAALAPTVEISDRAVNDVLFLQQMYDAGAKDFFDIMSANPYGLRSGPWDRRLDSDRDVNFSRPMLLRDVMLRHGDADKPIWGSEMGWNALPLDFPEDPLFGRVTREQQARYTVQAFQRIFEEWPWMGVVNLWHFRRVFPVNENEQMYYFGLVGQDYTPFPVYQAVKDVATSRPIAYRGYHQEYDWTVQYTGDWEAGRNPDASLGAYKFTLRPGDSIKFGFKGSKLSLVTTKGPAAGSYYVTIDSQPPPSLPRDASGRAILDLSADRTAWQQVMSIADGLSYGTHDVKLEAAPNSVDSAETKWYFDAFIVDGKPVNLALLIWPAIASLLGIPFGAYAMRVVIGFPPK